MTLSACKNNNFVSPESNYYELPGLGPRWNQRVFYIISGIVCINFALIISICIYSASIVSTSKETLTNFEHVFNDVERLLPDAENALRILQMICNNSTIVETHGIQCY